MTRTKLIDRKLPDYSRGEEIFNMVSHIVGGGFGVIALILCVVVAAVCGNTWGIVSGAIYGATMIVLYTMSSIYHGLKSEKAKKVFQVIDHCSIYFLIAGTYTPIAIGGQIREQNPVLAWIMFGIVWSACAVGVTLTAIDLEKYKVFSMICYILMGWVVVFMIKPVLQILPIPAFWWLLSGGIAYTVGAVWYGIGKKKKWMHSVFHLFVLLGSILQFVCVVFYIIPGK
ncbi:MAG: hemolysin III family protein [Clostridia bacterium]|nr:hemolysin III family protein [Clostridia bacterium]